MIVQNLPAQTTPFIGRASELAEINRLLCEPSCHLLTLVGPGGIGKTRLALETAARIAASEFGGRYAADFPHGICLVSLQPLTDPDSIPYAVAQAVGVQFFPGGEPRQQLLDYLRPKAMLLLLDNFEHLLDGVAFVLDILTNAPNVKIIATSRETLNLQEEWLYRITGMSFPQSEMDGELESYSAVRLFAECARRAFPGFLLETERQAVIRICHLVEGMPLALEMIASWLKRFPCHEIAQQIERGLDIFEAPSRNVPPRHRTMRAVFEHSWNLLSAAEQDVLAKLSVFRGGFWLAAGEAIAGASLASLSALIDKSLVSVTVSGRYQMHELLRQYGDEKLNVRPIECTAVRDLHCAYFADFMDQQWAHLKTGQQKSALDVIEVELENVLIAWHYALRRDTTAAIEKMAFSLSFFFYWRYRYPEAVSLLSQALETLQRGPHSLERDAILGHVMARLSWFQSAGGSAEKGHALVQAAFALLCGGGDPEYLIGAFHSLALAHYFLHRPRELELAAQEGLDVARNQGEQWWTAWFLYWLAHAAQTQGNHRGALRFGEAALSLTETHGELWLSACTSSFILATAAADLGDYSQAQQFARRGSQIFEEFGQIWGIACGYTCLGEVAFAQNELPEAEYYFQRRLRLFAENGQRVHHLIDSFLPFVRLLSAKGKKEVAVELLAFAHQHPVTGKKQQDEVDDLLARLRTEVPSQIFAVAWERGKLLDTDSVIANLLHTADEAPGRQDPDQPLPESLGERETEILRLIAGGLSNREIAEQSFLALSTVKWYIREIYSKLQVASRTQAVARARQLKLLD